MSRGSYCRISQSKREDRESGRMGGEGKYHHSFTRPGVKKI